MTDGLIGAVLSAVAVFLAAVVTISFARRGDRAREAVRLQEQDERRRTQAVAGVIATVRALESETRWAPFLRGRADRQLMEAIINFYLLQYKVHLAPANWLLARQNDFTNMMSGWRSVWFIPRINKARLGRASEFLGELASVLTLWAAGGLDDEAFDDASRAPRQLIESNRERKKSTRR